MTRPRTVVVTGAAARLSTRMLPALRERFDLRLVDVNDTSRRGEVVQGIERADLSDPDRDAYRELFRGADAVVHCAYMRADRSDRDAHFEAEQGNIRMAFNLYQVCLEEGVGRAVVLSSNHAADYLEDLVHENRLDVVTPDMRPLARGVYGWAKAAYEHLGFVFALGADGWPRLPNVQIRIGNVNETRYAGYGPDDQASMERALGAYLSARDQAQLAIRSLEAESLEDDDGVPFQIFYGISGNSHRFWSLANARRVVGYEPQDDSQILFADDVARVMRAVRDRDDG